MKDRLVLGITGGYGTGKTTVAGFFKKFGAKIIDADNIAHKMIRPGTKVYKKIIKHFGKDILKPDKSIERSELAKIVFSGKENIAKLNRIMHPEIKELIEERLIRADNKLIVLDAPLLFETGLDKFLDKIIVVKARKERQFGRLLKNTGLCRKQIALRIAAQMPLSEKVRRADFVIDNNGTIARTKKQAEEIIGRIAQIYHYTGNPRTLNGAAVKPGR